MEQIKISLPNDVKATIHVKAKRFLNGDIALYDHPDMIVVVCPPRKKIIALARKLNDHAYDSQKRLFDYLSEHGIINPQTIRMGNVFYSLEGRVYDSYKKEVDPVQASLYTIAKFFKQEEPYYQSIYYYENEIEQEATNPDDEDTTEHGEIPHKIDRNKDHYIYAGRNSYRTMYEE